MSDNEPVPSSPALATFGSMLMYGGAGFICLMILSRAADDALPLPGFLFQNYELWLVIGGAVVAAGLYCIRRGSTPAKQPIKPLFDKLVLYTRDDCPLCDKAKDMLVRYQHYFPTMEEVDIETDEHLEAQFGESIPVVEIDGDIRFRGRVDEVLLVRLINGARGQLNTASEVGS